MNNTDKIICPYCNTENDPFAYNCKNCGAPLPKSADSPYADDGFELGSVDGISGEDISNYIGVKANRILPHFFAISGGRTDWCWPAAIWAIALGPLGVAIWLLWRKVKKAGWCFLIVALLTALLPMGIYAFNESVKPQQIYTEQYNELKSQYAEAEKTVAESELQMEAVSQTVTVYLDRYTAFVGNVKIDLITLAVKTLCFALAGFYGYVWYKNTAINKIKHLRQTNFGSDYYRLSLLRSGQTSGGSVAVGLVIYFLATGVAEVLLARLLLM